MHRVPRLNYHALSLIEAWFIIATSRDHQANAFLFLFLFVFYTGVVQLS